MRRYFYSSKVRDEGNSVILYYYNREILPGPKDARICFTFLQQRGISVKLKEVLFDNDYL